MKKGDKVWQKKNLEERKLKRWKGRREGGGEGGKEKKPNVLGLFLQGKSMLSSDGEDSNGDNSNKINSVKMNTLILSTNL